MLFPEPTLFFTATIKDWQPLLLEDEIKDIVISSLQYLKQTNKIKIYGFVIMPNHIHLIVKIQENKESKETAMGSLLKFTAHEFKKELNKNKPSELLKYKVDEHDRSYRFWQDNPYFLEIYNEVLFTQKLDYIHNNPIAVKWKLVKDPVDYKYSSCRFYKEHIDFFGFLSNYYFE